MLTLYAIPVSLYCAKTRIALRHKQLDWHEVAPPGGYGSDEYKRIVASGNLPALEDDGVLIADSEAIVEYLEDRYPQLPLLPRDAAARAQMRERSRFHDTRLEPALRVLFGHLVPDRRDPTIFARQSAALNTRLSQLERLLDAAPDLGFGLGDCGLPVTFEWIETLALRLGLNIDWPAGVRAYRARLGDVPAVAAELADYRPKLLNWLDASDV